MPDWNTRLEIKLGNATIAPISAFTPTFNVPHTVIHSIDSDNVGYVRQPPVFLQDGDEVIVEIEGIGPLRNRARRA